MELWTLYINRTWGKTMHIFNVLSCSSTIPVFWESGKALREEALALLQVFCIWTGDWGARIPLTILRQLVPWFAAIFHFDFFGSVLNQMWVSKFPLESTKIELIRIMELDCGLYSRVTWGSLYFIARAKRPKTISFILELPRRLNKDQAYYCWVTNAA